MMDGMRYSWLVKAPAAVLLAVSACGSGQTGSLDCEVKRSCVCESLLLLAQYRAEIVALDPDAQEVTLSVAEELTEIPGAALPGEELQGMYVAGPPCALTPQLKLAVGDEVFAAYKVGPTAAPLWLARWDEPIAFGKGVSLAPHELAELADEQTCRAAYPAPDAECNDTYSATNSCSVRVSQSAGAPWRASSASVILLLAALWRRRRHVKGRHASCS